MSAPITRVVIPNLRGLVPEYWQVDFHIRYGAPIVNWINIYRDSELKHPIAYELTMDTWTEDQQESIMRALEYARDEAEERAAWERKVQEAQDFMSYGERA